MIDIKSVSNMYDQEIEDDFELREELLNELKIRDVRTSIDLNFTSTIDLFNIYKMIIKQEEKK